jgi:prevent-host-death family protein
MTMAMMEQYKLADAKARFSEIVQKAMLGEIITVTKENRPVVKIVPIKPATRNPGTGKGIWMSADFDQPLDDFVEYM